YAINPDTGAGIGAPVQITGLSTLLKTGALATDEVVSEFCGDGELNTTGETCDPPGAQQTNGQACRQDCTYCGDETVDPGEHCDANCHPLEICLDLIDNDGDGQVDCLDPDCDCLPIGRDPGAIRFGHPGAGDLFAVHGSLKPGSALDPTTDAISFLLTNANGEV